MRADGVREGWQGWEEEIVAVEGTVRQSTPRLHQGTTQAPPQPPLRKRDRGLGTRVVHARVQVEPVPLDKTRNTDAMTAAANGYPLWIKLSPT